MYLKDKNREDVHSEMWESKIKKNKEGLITNKVGSVLLGTSGSGRPKYIEYLNITQRLEEIRNKFREGNSDLDSLMNKCVLLGIDIQKMNGSQSKSNLDLFSTFDKEEVKERLSRNPSLSDELESAIKPNKRSLSIKRLIKWLKL